MYIISTRDKITIAVDRWEGASQLVWSNILTTLSTAEVNTFDTLKSVELLASKKGKLYFRASDSQSLALITHSD